MRHAVALARILLLEMDSRAKFAKVLAAVGIGDNERFTRATQVSKVSTR